MAKLWCFGDSFTAGHGCKYFGPIGAKFESHYQNVFKNYIDESKPIWSEIVSKHFGLELENKGVNGLSNEGILDYSLKNMPNISKEDVVILQSSTQGRYDFPFLKEKTLFGGYKKNEGTRSELYDMHESPYFIKTIFSTNLQSEWDEKLADSLQYINRQEHLHNKNLILNKNKYNTLRNFFVEFISTEKYYDIALWRIVQMSNIFTHIGVKSYIINESKWPSALERPENLIEMSETGIIGYITKNKQTIMHETSAEIDDMHPGYTGHIDIAKYIINHIERENTNLHNT